MSQLNGIRQYFAEEIQAVANIRSEALVNAFATVPREHFLGPGPWQMMSPSTELGGGSYRATPDADPRHVYHNVLIAIDPDRQLNNGQPSSLAFWLEALDLHYGERVVHVGCGVGYYTAIIAQVVGSTGEVIGIEIDGELAARARRNLAHLNHVQVVHGDGGEYNSEPSDVIFVNAGVTHPQPVWLNNLRAGGRLMVPITFSTQAAGIGTGFMLKVKRESKGFAARFVSPVTIYHCVAVRDVDMNQRLRNALMRGGWQSVQSLRRDSHKPSDSCWFHDVRFCLSTLPVPTGS
jgi:protein-L-isoaspartate(D-aspartate) O-methyltransferase